MMWVVEKNLRKVVGKSIDSVVRGFVRVIVSGFVRFIGVGGVGRMVGTGIWNGVRFIYDDGGLLGGVILGGG